MQLASWEHSYRAIWKKEMCYRAICMIAVAILQFARELFQGVGALKRRCGGKGEGAGTSLRTMFAVCSTLIAGDGWWRGAKRLF